MPLDVLLDFLNKYEKYCIENGINGAIVLHGGEPLLMGTEYIAATLAHRSVSSGRLFPILQTNGSLINEEWASLFAAHKLEVGVSLDGPRHIHNKHRRAKNGRDSYEETVRGIRLLQQHNVRLGALAVVDEEEDGAEVFEHIIELGINQMDFLMPMHTRMEEPFSSVATGTRKFLLSAFNAWYKKDDPSITIRLFMTLMRKHLTEHSGYFPTGVSRWDEFAVLETDGTVARLEELSHVDRIAGTDFYNSHLSFQDSDLDDIALEMTSFWNRFPTADLPSECRSCTVNSLCRGGNFGTRFSHTGSFDNRSAHCKSLKALAQQIVLLHEQHTIASKAN